MKHLIQHSHKGQPLLLIALLAASAGAAKAQAISAKAGTVALTIYTPTSGSTYPMNTMVRLLSGIKATANGVDATASTTTGFDYGLNTMFYATANYPVAKNTSINMPLPTLSGQLPYSGDWTAAAECDLTAPGTTTVASISSQGFTVTP